MGPVIVALALAAPYHRDVPAPSRQWETLTTEHFAFHYPASDRRDDHVGAEGVARWVAGRADVLLAEMVTVMGERPLGRVQVLVTDDQDAADAFTMPHWDWIVISAHPGFQVGRTRGRSDPALEAFAHELGHLISHKATAALPERLNYGIELIGSVEGARGAGGMRLELDHNRPYAWSEGTAEWLAERVGVVAWTAERDAQMRTAALEGRLLSWAELQIAHEKDPGDAERAYQQGYAFARWLAARFGDDVHRRMAAHASTSFASGWSSTLRAVTGHDGPTLHADFVDDLAADAARVTERVEARGVAEGDELITWRPSWMPASRWAEDHWAVRSPRDREAARESTGAWRLCPRVRDGWLLEGRVGWVIATRAEDSLTKGITGAWPAESGDPDKLWIPSRFGAGFDHGPGGAWVVAPRDAHRAIRTVRPSHLDQVFWVDLTDDDLDLPVRRRMTPVPGTDRAVEIAATRDGARLAFLRTTPAGQELVVGPPDGSAWEVVDAWGPEAEARGLAWSPEGQQLVTAQLRAGQVDLWVVDVGRRAWTPLTDDGWSEGEPTWDAEGIWFTADVDGVRDVFRLGDEGVTRITSERVGAWCPSTTPDGHLLYSRPTAHGVKAVALGRWRFLGDDATSTFAAATDPLEAEAVRRPAPRTATLPSTRYRASRSLLAPSLGPFARVDASGPQLSPSVGVFGTARDAAERYELAVWGLVGDDRAGQLSTTARVAWLELGLWGASARERWREPHQGRGLDQVGLTASRTVFPSVELALGASWSWLSTPARLTEGRLVPALHLDGLGDGPDDQGADLSVGWTAARTQLPEVDPLHWGRAWVEGEAHGALWDPGVSGGALRAEVRWVAAWSGAGLPDEDLLAAGGETPGALRTTVLEPSHPLPGYAPYAIRGERMAVAGLAGVVPVGSRWRAGGRSFTLRRLELLAGADGALAGPVETAAADLRTGLRVLTMLRDSSFDSQLLLAWPLIPVGPAPTPVPTATWPAGPRWILSLGAGF